MKQPLVKVVDLGWIGFKEAWDIQQQYFDELVARKLANRDKADEEKEPLVHYLLICEHPHVYTLGKSGKIDHLLIQVFHFRLLLGLATKVSITPCYSTNKKLSFNIWL